MFGVSVHILPADKLLLIIVVFNALITNGEANEVPLGKQRTLGLIVLIIIVVIAVDFASCTRVSGTCTIKCTTS